MKKILFLFFILNFSFAFAKDTFGMAVSNTTQQNYRWRNDDGTESTATWIAAANTSITNVDTATTIRLRFSFNETNGVLANVAGQIEVGTNADCVTGTWTPLDTSTTTWQIVTSSNASFVDLGTTTQQIGTGSVASPYGYTSESSNPVTSVSLTSQVSEAEWAIKGVNAAGSTTYYFRVTAGGTALNSYTNCAQLTTSAAVAPTKVVFTNAARTLTAGVCNGAGNVFTMQLQDNGGTPRNPTGSTVIRITSNSGNYTIYSDTGCTSSVTNGDFTFTTAENTKSVYIIDTKKSITTRTLTATKQSGPDTITTGTQNYTVNAGSVTKLVITLPGETFTDGTGNSGTVDCNGGAAGTSCTAGTSFTITKISATDDYFNINTGYSPAGSLSYSGPSNAPNGQAPSYTTAVTFSSGQSTTTLTTTLYDAQTTTITVTDGGSFGNASSSLTVDPGALNDFAVSVSTPQTAGVCFTGTNTVTARDSWQNTRTQDTSVVDMTSSGTGITFYTTGSCGTSTTQYTMSSGTSNIYILTTKKQTFTVTATKNGSTETGTSGTITVNAGAVTKLVITLPGQSFTDGTGNSGSPTNRTAGSSFTITKISATDDYFNVNTSYPAGPTTLVYSGPSNAPDTTAPSYTTSVTFSSGQSTTTLTTTLFKAETTTITVTDAGNYGNASSSVTVDPGNISADVNDSTVTGNATVQVNVPLTVTITLKDTWRNPKVGITASHITLVSTGGSFNQPSVNTDSNGQTTGTVTWTTEGAKTVSVQITVDSLVQNDGVTADADGFLDNTLAVNVTPTITNTSVQGSLRIKGNTRIK